MVKTLRRGTIGFLGKINESQFLCVRQLRVEIENQYGNFDQDVKRGSTTETISTGDSLVRVSKAFPVRVPSCKPSKRLAISTKVGLIVSATVGQEDR